MKQSLKIAEDLILPIDAVTQTFGAIGRKGAGKTYLATMIAEQMLDAMAQVIVIDPVGNWWGLRVGGDGKSEGKIIFVIGGDHGDVPLVPEAGARIARLLVEKNISAVLDVSTFRQNERKRFAADFAEEFFHLKKSQRSPVHLFIEEAQLFIPQRVGPEEARMVGAWESIVRLGRNYGIGATLVTQRPQSVNKEVLSQVECLCVLQVNGSHERKALEEWVQEAGADRKLVGELPGLARGEGYVWSPSWLRIFKHVRFGKKVTFDASATPEVGKATRAARLSSMDVEALRNDLSEVIKEAEEDDPRALKRRIRELEMVARRQGIQVPDKAVIEGARFEGATEERIIWNKRRIEWAAELRRFLLEADSIRALAERMIALQLPPTVGPKRTISQQPAPMNDKDVVWVDPSVIGLGKAERLILTALHHYPQGRSKVQVALLTGYTHSGGSFNNAISSLRSKAFIEGGNERLVILPAGEAAIGPVDPLPRGVDLLRKWQSEVGKAEREILDVLFEVYPRALSKSEIAATTVSKYQPQGGSFNNALSRLRTIELIKGRREMVLSEELVG